MAESSNFDYANICDKLDDLSIEILNTMQNIILERQYLDDNLKEGFINVAKSRYLMREQQISILQIDTTNLRASKEVVSVTEVAKELKFLSFHINNKKNSVDAFMESQSDTELCSYRNKHTKTTDENYSSEKSFQNSEKNSSSVKNPLNWFGVLVPDSLKTCQSRFEQVIETSAKIVSLQNQLKALSEEYKRIRKEKFVLDA